MKSIAAQVLLAMLLLAFAETAAAQVAMTGDARVWANEGNAPLPGKSGGSTTVWERVRMRTDFNAGEDLKFRLSVRANNNGQLKSLENGVR